MVSRKRVKHRSFQSVKFILLDFIVCWTVKTQASGKSGFATSTNPPFLTSVRLSIQGQKRRLFWLCCFQYDLRANLGIIKDRIIPTRGDIMVDHYFSDNPNLKHDFRRFADILRGREFTFITDAGVFSRDRIDRGTRLMLESVELDGASKILDLGCGYGVIGVVAAKLLPNSSVTMVDVNDRGVKLSRWNIELNKVNNAVALCSDGFSAIGEQHFDLILTNPPIRAGKQVMYRLVDEAVAHLMPGGRFCAVIRTKQGAKSYQKKMQSVFQTTSEIAKGGGYRVLEGTYQ
jgi:16S rRNA (guanine1207-N2)-methyltransferase